MPMSPDGLACLALPWRGKDILAFAGEVAEWLKATLC